MKVLFFLFVSLSASVLANPYPLSVTDELGRTITLEQEPLRIVSMIPSHTESICALNACDKLIGVDSFSDYPEQVLELPKLGGGLTGFDGGPDIEAIVALQPDLVLVSEYGELADILVNAGLSVYAGSPQTVAETYEIIRVLGLLLNREAEATALVTGIQANIAAVAQMTANLAPVSVYYEIDATPFSVGPESFIGTLIAAAGGANIVDASLGDFPMLDPEFVIATDPDIIILANAPYGESLESLAARPGWASLTAVQEGRVYELSEEIASMTGRAGPRIAEVVLHFASLFHPQVFD